MSGYFQPIKIHGPGSIEISTASGGSFSDPLPTPVTLGMLVAPVYRLRVRNIPYHPGVELFPTIEIIDRLYPPPAEATRFPIPIEITQEDLDLAMDGMFVTRVIYVEDPAHALPLASSPRRLREFDVAPHDDPLTVADGLGRPVAILRIGSRVPSPIGPDSGFLFHSPPIQHFETVITLTDEDATPRER